MKKVKQIRFVTMIFMPDYLKPEEKQLNAEPNLTIQFHTETGVYLSWPQHSQTDQTSEPNKNVICETFIPMHMIQQIIFENEDKSLNDYEDRNKVIQHLVEARNAELTELTKKAAAATVSAKRGRPAGTKGNA